jgi:hypothetical protein
MYAFGQEVAVLSEENLLENPEAETPGINLTQLGTQNTAEIFQYQNFGSQLSSQQQGEFNQLLIIQSGTGYIQTWQLGRSNDISTYLEGTDIGVQLYQSGEDNLINQWSNADYTTYQFVQNGTNNFIEHINSSGNNMSLYILQTGNNMSISIFTR